MANPSLVKSMVAEAAVLPYRVVKFGAADGQVVQAAAAGDLCIGVSDELGQVTAGGRVDITISGIAEVVAGGVVARGAPVTSDANGAVVTAVATNAVIGRAMATAAAGDIIPVNIVPGMF